jgi:hypothetical protein
MLNTISPQFLQSLQPLQTVPTVKLPAAPRTFHNSNFVVSYNTRRSLLVWLSTQRLYISVVLLVALSPNQVENIPPIFPPYHHLCGPAGSSLTKSTRKYTTNISTLSPLITTPLLKRCPSRPPPWRICSWRKRSPGVPQLEWIQILYKV